MNTCPCFSVYSMVVEVMPEVAEEVEEGEGGREREGGRGGTRRGRGTEIWTKGEGEGAEGTVVAIATSREVAGALGDTDSLQEGEEVMAEEEEEEEEVREGGRERSPKPFPYIPSRSS